MLKRLSLLMTLMAALTASACVSADVQRGDIADDAPMRDVDEYRLGAGDRLRVIVFEEPDLSGEFVIDGAGNVSLPLIGQVRATDQTLREFETAVEGLFSQGYLNAARVNAEVLNYRPFYILGEVNEPGVYPYSEGLTVYNAVATAGGFTYRASDSRVRIQRADSTAKERYLLTPETPVRPGDTIWILQRYF